jgi:hypothetical protein
VQVTTSQPGQPLPIMKPAMFTPCAFASTVLFKILRPESPASRHFSMLVLS